MIDWLDTISRVALGLNVLFFGINGFTHWLTIPKGEPAFEEFIEALVKAKFILPTVKVIEILAGLMLLSNQRVTLALALLAPIIFGVAGAHLALNRTKGLMIVSSLVGPFVFMLYYRQLELSLLFLSLR